MTTMAQARDDISTFINTAWQNATYQGQPVIMRWTGAGRPELPPTDLPWARTTITNTSGDQRSLGGIGSRRFERLGLVQVQIFAPLNDSSRLSLSETYSTLVRDSLEGRATPNGVWFRRVYVQDVGVDQDSGAWWQTNVVASFTYDEMK